MEASIDILLIDEIETSIHAKYYEKIFSFVILACKQFNFHLFITTHNMVALDTLLNVQNYDTNKEDSVSVITLKKDKDSSKTLSIVLLGKRVLSNRVNFGFEIRL